MSVTIRKLLVLTRLSDEKVCRVDPSRSRENEGRGLGLAICREIAKLHGGRIGIGGREGEGTIISVF